MIFCNIYIPEDRNSCYQLLVLVTSQATKNIYFGKINFLSLFISFLTLKYSISIIHMGAALAEFCLLGNKARSILIRGIYWP